MTAVSPGQLCMKHVGGGNQTSAFTPAQGYTPEKLPPSSCVMAPELSPPNPAKSLFAKVTKTLFGKKKPKGESTCSHGNLLVILSPGRSGFWRALLGGPLLGDSTRCLCPLVPALPLLVAGMGVRLGSGCCPITHGDSSSWKPSAAA